jgi:hypothetical protein
MQKLNRMALVVMSREPLADWVNTVDSEHPVWIDTIGDSGNVYLIPEFKTIDEVEDWLEDNFDDIFRNELTDWVPDEKVWPEVRTYDMFCEWFDVLFDVVPFDMLSEPLLKH